MSTPESSSPQASASLGWVALIVAVVTAVLVGLMLILPDVGLPMSILGTALLALGFGGTIVMLLGNLKPLLEKAVTSSCLVAIVLGVLCFESFDVRLWVGATSMLVWVALEVVRARGSRMGRGSGVA